ncbi:MAG: DUF6364 family protein [bacterium]
MQTKLTLRMDKETIEKAKRISRVRRKSVSQLVADFIKREDISESLYEIEISPLVKKMRGLLKDEEVTSDEYYDYLEAKHK